jgi:chondroitin AC lyase
MHHRKGGLQARKAWFFFDKEAVCLGADITSEASQPVLTTINQCHLRGQVATSEDEGRRALEGVWWAHHDGVGYLVPVAFRPRVRLRAASQTGSWHTINRSYPETPVTLEVFRIWTDHGPEPKGATYAYAILPSVSIGDLEATSWPAEIVANRPDLQAVYHPKLEMVGTVFYRPGAVTISGMGLTLSVKEPAILLLQQTPQGTRLAAASPEHREMVLEVFLSLPLRGDGAQKAATGGTRISFPLPGGPLAGSSIVRVLSPDSSP